MVDETRAMRAVARSRFERSAWEEAVIVGLYTAVMQLSVLAGFDEDNRAAQIRLIVGTAIGILCAHLFAAVLGRQFMSEQALPTLALHLPIAIGIMAGVVFVSAISLAPYVLFRNSDDPGSIATFFLVLVIGYAGYGASRTGGLTLRRSILTAVVMVLIAGTVAVVKATLTH